METAFQVTSVAIVALIFGYFFLSFPKPQSILTDILDDEYDYIIVGAGSAGSVVASRLSEDKNKKVLLLEAGGHFGDDPNLHIPLYTYSLQHTEYDWGYYTEPQEVSQLGLKDTRGYMPQGKVLGGSNMINFLQYTRGSKYDYDEWARNGCTGWSHREVFPYFLKSEDIKVDELKTSKYHHSGGPLAVSSARATPLAELYMNAGKEAGYNITDYNGEHQEGFSYIQLNTRRGSRSSSSIEVLGNTAHRENLHIAIHSFVTKIEIVNERATGVFVIRNLKKYFIKARQEIILSAGAISSPQILLLSGVGPKEHLEEMGIPVKANLPVGKNFQDHQMLILPSKINASYSITENVRESYWSKLKYAMFGTGPLAIAGSEGSGFFYVDESRRGIIYPDIQFIFLSVFPYNNHFNFKDEIAKELLAKDPNEHGFSTLLAITHPKSTGTVKLKSTDPFDYPSIDPKYLTKQQDIDNFIAGIRIWEKVMETPTMKKIGVNIEQLKMSICSPYQFRSDAYWDCFTRHLAVNLNHHSGTCKMGAENDPTSVLDPHLRVKGIKGLRVVGTPIFPNVTSGNTNIPAIMSAEKLSDDIRGIDSVREIKNKLQDVA